jgi:putative tricarboxylic transport membrane protein
MATVDLLLIGFSVAMEPLNLLVCFLGVLTGTMIGVLPGIGPIATMSILLPATFGIPPATAIIMLAGIFYGAMYGGSTTSILVNIPGEAASVVTCLDGYQMALQGRAGPALGISAIGSFVGGTLSVAGLMLCSQPLAHWAVKFGPVEYTGLMLLGLIAVVFLVRQSVIKGIIMVCLGLFLGMIGQDIVSGRPRFTFGMFQLQGGIDFLPLVIGLFGLSEVLINIDTPENRQILSTKIKQIWPSSQDLKRCLLPILRATGLGFFLGFVPGGGVITSPFFSYAIEKRLSRNPERFGKGAIEGVAGPETANNAASISGFIPLFSLGIPANVVLALLMGAMMIHGIQPGPLLLSQKPEMFWGFVASMYIGNVMCLILNLPLVGVWVQLLKVPSKILFPLIVLFCLVGVYTVNNNVVDIYIMAFFGIVGYVFRKKDYEPAPLAIAFILERLIEENLRQALTISHGSFRVFLSNPISFICILFSILIITYSSLRRKVFRKKL